MKKNIFVCLSLAALAMGTVSCGDDFLTVEPLQNWDLMDIM